MTVTSTFFGPLFPDRVNSAYPIAATFAQLSLAPTQTNSGNLDNVVLRSRVEGSYGNLTTVEFRPDALTSAGEISEDVPTQTVLVRFMGDVTTVGELAALFAASELVEMVGTWDPLAVIASGDDDFDPTPLTGGAQARTGLVTFWGPLFPDASLESAQPDRIRPTGGEGAATFVSHLESGVQVRLEWSTNVFKARDGSERRSSRVGAPRQSYAGEAFLVGSDVTRIRGYIQRFAARGATFMLGVAHEGATLLEDADFSAVLAVNTGDLDWAVPGQQVVVVDEDGHAVQFGVVQDASPTTLTVDIETTATRGCDVVPLLPVLLDPQQGFARFPLEDGDVERWSLQALGKGFGYRSGNIPARLALGPLAVSDTLDDVFFYARSAGAAANGIDIELVGNSVLDINIEVLVTGGEVSGILIHFIPDTSTAGDLFDAVTLQQDTIAMIGSWDPDAVLTLDDELSGELAGGADEAPAPVGVGATLTEYLDRPVFDRGVDVDEAADDSVHSLAEILAVGESPTSFGAATTADYGRQLAITRTDTGEWQWLKKFLWAVRGRWKAWWFPTYRRDLEPASDVSAGGTTLDVDAEHGDFWAWWSTHRQHVAVYQGDSVYYVEITAAVLGSGVITLTLAGDLPDDGPVDMVSWLDLCRLESDSVTVRWQGSTFSVSELARAVQR